MTKSCAKFRESHAFKGSVETLFPESCLFSHWRFGALVRFYFAFTFKLEFHGLRFITNTYSLAMALFDPFRAIFLEGVQGVRLGSCSVAQRSALFTIGRGNSKRILLVSPIERNFFSFLFSSMFAREQFRVATCSVKEL